MGTARADTLKSSSEEEQGRREVGRGLKRRGEKEVLDEAHSTRHASLSGLRSCLVLGLVLQHQAATGFSSHSSRPAAGCVWLCVCQARMCVCVSKNYAKTSCATLGNFSCKFEIEIRRGVSSE